MELTEDQIKKAGELKFPYNAYCKHGFEVGAQWMQKEIQPKWISVDDRLPQLNQEVLVFVPDLKKAAICNYNHFEDWNNTGFVYIGVTHWQPLPEPPNASNT